MEHHIQSYGFCHYFTPSYSMLIVGCNRLEAPYLVRRSIFLVPLGCLSSVCLNLLHLIATPFTYMLHLDGNRLGTLLVSGLKFIPLKRSATVDTFELTVCYITLTITFFSSCQLLISDSKTPVHLATPL